jgi:hypothetical protein
MARTVISSRVRVPVLSEQITEVLPRVSTVGSRRTRAWRLTMRCTPMASEMVTTAGRASGTTATASATPKMNISSIGSPRSTPSPAMSTTTTPAAMASTRPTLSRFCCSGVRSCSTPASMPVTRPNSVPRPVSTTTPRPRP